MRRGAGPLGLAGRRDARHSSARRASGSDGIAREAIDPPRGAGMRERRDQTLMPEHRLPYGPLARIETERILRETYRRLRARTDCLDAGNSGIIALLVDTPRRFTVAYRYQDVTAPQPVRPGSGDTMTSPTAYWKRDRLGLRGAIRDQSIGRRDPDPRDLERLSLAVPHATPKAPSGARPLAGTIAPMMPRTRILRPLLDPPRRPHCLSSNTTQPRPTTRIPT